MMFLLRLLTRKRGPAMDPLHVSMTGVRMGERFLLMGVDDRALLAGLAAKVGLSGNAAAAVFDEDQARRARKVGASVGALIDVQDIANGRPWTFGDAEFDMVVVDDTAGGFAGRSASERAERLRQAHRAVRGGGRIEVIARAQGGPPVDDVTRELEAAGFKPVRLLAERDGFRFMEGLKPMTG